MNISIYIYISWFLFRSFITSSHVILVFYLFQKIWNRLKGLMLFSSDQFSYTREVPLHCISIFSISVIFLLNIINPTNIQQCFLSDVKLRLTWTLSSSDIGEVQLDYYNVKILNLVSHIQTCFYLTLTCSDTYLAPNVSTIALEAYASKWSSSILQ